MSDRKKQDDGKSSQEATAGNKITVTNPVSGVSFSVERPPVGSYEEGQVFNRTVMHPQTRESHAARFKNVNGQAEPV